VRVTVPRPPTARCIDNEAAATDTAASVWRAVPRVINAALTAPFQHDGREATLQAQALSAMRAHGSGATPPSPDAPLSVEELRGCKTFEDFCASCHGRAAQTTNTDARFLPPASRGPLTEGAPTTTSVR